MPTNLTGSTIADTFDQLLHVNDGPEATEKVVYSGTGVATALKVGTQSASVDNIKLDGNTISTTDTNGDLILSPNGTGEVVVDNLAISGNTISSTDTDGDIIISANGAGTVTIDKANITGGSIGGAVSFAGGSFSGMTLVSATTITGTTTTNGGNLRLTGNTLSSTDTNGNINLTPNGTGSVVVSKIDVTAGTIPFGVLAGRAYAAFCDITDQTGSVSAATAVKFGTTDIAGAGITMVTDGANLTRLTFAVAGTYMIAPSLQFANSDSSDHDATVWFALDGVAIPRSATKVTIPKAADGGNLAFQIVFYVTVTAGQYVQLMWLPENVAVTLDHTAAGAIAPAIPSAIIVSERIA